jgi:DNA-binding NarL/FixJ family response regulator
MARAEPPRNSGKMSITSEHRGAAEPLDSRDVVHCAPTPLKVLIADDHPLILSGVRRLLEDADGVEVAGQATCATELLALIERRCPDVVLTDLRMPGVTGPELIAQIKERWPAVPVVVLSASDDPASVDSALLAGASAFVVKTANPVDVASVLRQVCGAGSVFHAAVSLRPPPRRGGEPVEEAAGPVLTERERTILEAVAGGLTTAAISKELWVSEHTVKFHLTNIYRKLGVSNRAGAVRYALENGLAAAA